MSKYRVKEINKQIEDLLNEKKEIQEKCDHQFYRIEKHDYRIGSSAHAKVCVVCEKVLITEFANDLIEGTPKDLFEASPITDEEYELFKNNPNKIYKNNKGN